MFAHLLLILQSQKIVDGRFAPDERMHFGKCDFTIKDGFVIYCHEGMGEMVVDVK